MNNNQRLLIAGAILGGAYLASRAAANAAQSVNKALRPGDWGDALGLAINNYIVNPVENILRGAQDMANDVPRGIRNNNPGNIVATAINWRGKTGNDGRFETFDSMENGARALIRNLYSRSLDNPAGTSISQVIAAWAPPHENNTGAYIAFVEQESGYQPADILNPRDASMMANVARAIAIKENGWAGVNRHAPYLADTLFWLRAWERAGLGSL